MELTIFAKNKTTKEGKPFLTYFTRLHKSDGTEVSCEVKFREECGTPKGAFPLNIVVDKKNANFVTKDVTYLDSEGVEQSAVQNRLWITSWEAGSEYIDHSLDDFVD